MPAYNFKKQFAPLVKSGQKRQTIRPKRKRPTVPGDTLKLYTGMRTTNCELLLDTTCHTVEPVEIHSDMVKVGDNWLADNEIETLAQADGFPNMHWFFTFFIETYGLSPLKPITNMELIKW